VAAQEDWPATVRMMTAMGRMLASQVRALAPRPFGLKNDALRLPAFVASVSAQSADAAEQPSLLGALTSMTLSYGIPEDPLSPYVQVVTDFTADHRDTVSLRYAIGEAVGRERSQQSGEPQHARPRHRPPRGPLDHGRLEIVVAGKARIVSTQSYANFHGLQFSDSGLVATVIARGSWPDHPAFYLMTDLEPYLTAIESPDSEVVKAKLRALQAARLAQLSRNAVTAETNQSASSSQG
jgi:hypothetical protein